MCGVKIADQDLYAQPWQRKLPPDLYDEMIQGLVCRRAKRPPFPVPVATLERGQIEADELTVDVSDRRSN
jgi:hypothetical protein